MARNSLKVSADGSVIILGVGRRPMTTSYAYANPYYNGFSAWSSFVRQYNPIFLYLYIAALFHGIHLATQPAFKLYNTFKTVEGIVVVGKHLGIEEDVPVSNIPNWGNATFDGESAFIFTYP